MPPKRKTTVADSPGASRTMKTRSGPKGRKKDDEAESRITEGPQLTTDVVHSHVVPERQLEEGNEQGENVVGTQSSERAPPTGGVSTEAHAAGPSICITKHIMDKDIDNLILQNSIERFIDKRNTLPPPVPLCRLVPNESIRIVGPQVTKFKSTFDKYAYGSTMAPFLVSLHPLGSEELMEITEEEKKDWCPIWVKVNDEFEKQLENTDWVDLKNHKFLVWDGNHRLKGWSSRIREAWCDVPSRHIKVNCQFIKVDRGREGELLLALQTQNELAKTNVQQTLSHEIYMFQQFGKAEKSSIMQFLGDDISRSIELEMGLERRRGLAAWYNTPAAIIAQLVWKTQFNESVLEATRGLDQHVMTKEEYELKYEKAVKGVEHGFRDRAYKMLVIANPNNGEDFHRLLFNYDWSQRAGSALTKEKLYILCYSKLSSNRKREILQLLMSCNPKNQIAHEMFGDNRKFTITVKKAVYWEGLLSYGTAVATSQLCTLEAPITFERYWTDARKKHHLIAFPDLWKDVGLTKVDDEQPELVFTARRLVYRWILRLVEIGFFSNIPEEYDDWTELGSICCIYPDTWKEKGLSEWELRHCPWWMDYPLGITPDDEHKLKEDFSKLNKRAWKLSTERERSLAAVKQPKAHLQQDKEGAASSVPPADVVLEAESHFVHDEVHTEEREQRTKHGLDYFKQGKEHDASLTKDTTEKEATTSKGAKEKSGAITLSKTNIILDDIINIASNALRVDEFMKTLNINDLHHSGEENPCLANVVFADFPTGLLVEEIESEEVPKWNIYSSALMKAVVNTATIYTADEGWFLTLSLAEHTSPISVFAKKRGFALYRMITVQVLKGYMYEEGDEVKSLILQLFYRKSCEVPDWDRHSGSSVGRGCFPENRNYILEGSHRLPFTTSKVGRMAVRGGAERSTNFFRWLVHTFTEEEDLVMDIFAGCGQLGKVCKDLGRHYLGFENDVSLQQDFLDELM